MRIAHLSDLHFGRHDENLASELAADIAAQAPQLIVVSGDFTQVGSEAEFIAARAFLDRLAIPVFAVPGNHDIPVHNLFRRFLDPYGWYRRHIAENLEPFIEIDGVALAGIKTSRRMRPAWNWADGSISRDQLDALAGRFADASPDAVRVVVAHHPLLHPSEPMAAQMRRVKRADLALELFGRLGVQLVLSGHFHLSYVRRHTSRREVVESEPDRPHVAAVAPILVAQASTPISTRLRGHPNAYNIVDIVDGTIAINLREWDGTAWRTRDMLVSTP